MDPQVLVALIGAAGGTGAGALVTAWLGRRQRAAQTDLVRTQIGQVREELYARLVDELQEERDAGRRRIAELEDRVRHLEEKLVEHTAEETRLRRALADVTAERDRLLGEVAAKDRELTDLKLLLAGPPGGAR